MAGPTDKKLQAMLELERRGALPDSLKPQLDMYRQQGLAKPLAGPGGNLTEGQGKDSGFYTRALGANETYSKIGGDQLGGRSAIGQWLSIHHPDLLNTLPSAVGNSNERQQTDAAVREFVAATLRMDSGAAIPPSEFDLQYRTYFPSPGDGPDVIAQKAQARQRAIEGLKISSGPAASAAEAAAQHSLQSAPPAAMPSQQPPAPPAGPDLGTDHPTRMQGDIGFNMPKEPANPLTAEQQAAYNAWNKANPHATADQLRAFAGSLGINLANAESIVAARDKGAGVRSAATAKLAPVDPGDGRLGAAERGFVDTASLNLAPRLTAVENTIRHGGTYAENLAAQQGYREFDEQNHPWMRLAGSVPGAMALPLGVGKTAGEVALAAGGQGAAYGYFGSPDLTDLGQSGVNALAGGALSAAGGYGFTKASNALASRIAASPGRVAPGGAAAVDIAQAGQAEGVPLSRPIVDPSVRDRMAYLESNIGSGGTVRNALADTRNAIEQRTSQLGAGGTAQESGILGEQVQNAGQRFIDKSRNVGRRLYDRAASLAGDNKVLTSNAVNAIDRHIADLSENQNANGPLIKYLQEIRADLTDANGNPALKSIASIRDLRTGLRGQINSRNLTATDAERRIGEVLDAAKSDIGASLGVKAPSALKAYEKADEFWKARSDEIKQVVQAFIGPKDNPLSGEKVVARLKAMASPKGDSARLSRMLDKLSPDERADVAATIAANLGRRSPEDEFSPALFVSSARALSPTARQAIFGAEGAKSIENLRRLSEALRDTESRLNNSRSGQVVNWKTTIRELLGGSVAGVGVGTASGSPVGGIVTGAALAGGGAVVRKLSARALMSPDMSRWLAVTPKLTTKAAILSHIGRLADVAKKDPAIAQEATGLRQFLLSAVNDNAPNAGRAVASPNQGPDNQQNPESR